MSKGKGRPGLSGDPRLDCALWQLAEVLAEIASSVNHLEKNSKEISKNVGGHDNGPPIQKEEPKQG